MKRIKPKKSPVIYALFLIGNPFYLLFRKISKAPKNRTRSLFKFFGKASPPARFINLLFLPLRCLFSSKKNFLISLLTFITLFLIFDLYLLFSFFHSLPSPLLLKTRKVALTTKIYDRNGELLYKIYDRNHNRTLVLLDQIPLKLRQATIAIEDKDFYSHGALSLSGILRAFRQNLKGNREGGSTITQQLVKNALLSSDKTLDRKLKEMILAIQTELIFSKDEILTMYFNEVGYGGTTYGIEEASETYFGKKVSDLNLSESALLAGLPAAPTYYSPFGANPGKAIVRQKEVLNRMVEDGYITKDQMQKAISQKLIFAPQITDIKAPHFVMYVKDELAKKYGESVVEKGGLTVITTLNHKIQGMVQNEVTTGVTNQKYLNVKNGASLVINPISGEILAMVGSINYFDSKEDGNVNVVLMPRQPGSAIKPVNYAAAFSLRKITPATIISDSPITFSYENSPSYSPQNYDGRFHGLVTVRKALANSLNVPAVKILNSYGVDKMIDLGEKLGITTWQERNRFGLALTLGGGEVKMIDLAKVFSTFANEGKTVPLKPILKVIDSQGNILEDNTSPGKGEEVISPGVAFLISNILADNYSRSLIFGANSSLYIPQNTVSVKTGTTESKKDNWTIGYTKDYLAAVWIGNNDSSPMSPYLESGYTGAAPIWHNIMVNLLKSATDKPLVVPNDIVKTEICLGDKVSFEYFLAGTEPQNPCPVKKLP